MSLLNTSRGTAAGSVVSRRVPKPERPQAARDTEQPSLRATTAGARHCLMQLPWKWLRGLGEGQGRLSLGRAWGTPGRRGQIPLLEWGAEPCWRMLGPASELSVVHRGDHLLPTPCSRPPPGGSELRNDLTGAATVQQLCKLCVWSGGGETSNIPGAC